MADLTTTERTVVDNMSEVLNRNVHLGALIQGIIDDINGIGVPEASIAEVGTPVNAVKAKIDLNITSVSVDGETLTIGDDVFEFLADDEQTLTDPDNIPVDIVNFTVKAFQTLTIDTQPTSGNKMTIGTKVYTFVPVGTDTADGEISIGTDLATAQAAIVAAINGSGFNVAHPLVTASAFEANISTITALVGGTAGNSIATTETFTAETNIFGGTTLASGGNCSGANTITVLTDAINDLYGGNEMVVATEGSGKIVLEAVVAGLVGNAITVSDTMANGNFGGKTHLEGGINGTAGEAGKLLIDDNYIYICTNVNTILDANWRRVDLGSVY